MYSSSLGGYDLAMYTRGRGPARGDDVSQALDGGGEAVVVGPYNGPAAEWDGLVRSVPGWTHFHLHGWHDLMQRTMGHECLYLGARNANGDLRGILPLVRVRSRLFGHYLVSMPFLNYGGPLGAPEVRQRLAESARELATELGVAYMDAHSAINKNAVDFLYDASSILEKIEKKEMKASDSAKIDELRNKIREL